MKTDKHTTVRLLQLTLSPHMKKPGSTEADQSWLQIIGLTRVLKQLSIQSLVSVSVSIICLGVAHRVIGVNRIPDYDIAAAYRSGLGIRSGVNTR